MNTWWLTIARVLLFWLLVVSVIVLVAALPSTGDKIINVFHLIAKIHGRQVDINHFNKPLRCRFEISLIKMSMPG